MEKEFKRIDGGITAEQIQGWKNRHGRVSEVSVKDPDTAEEHVGWFKRPDMKTMEAVSALSKKSEVQGSVVLLDNCWLGGSEALKNDAIYRMEAMTALAGLFGRCVNTLKNV